jgi:hypothetical protein
VTPKLNQECLHVKGELHMRGSLTVLKRVSGGIVELALGALVVGLLIAALHPGKSEAKAAAPRAAAIQQVPTGGTLCIVDDSNGNQLTFEAATGAYTFTACRTGFTLSGTGLVKIKGCQVTLTHIAADRRVTAVVDFCVNKGKASAQTFSPASTKTIGDRNITDDVCGCVVADAASRRR